MAKNKQIRSGAVAKVKTQKNNNAQLGDNSVAMQHLNPAVQQLLMPTGVVLPFAGTSAPSGYLVCDGSTVSRTTYASLFAIIGTAHGNGDGSTTFHLPDYRGRFLRGVDGSAGRDPNDTARTAMNSGGNTGDAVGSVQGSAAPNITGYAEFTSLAPTIDTNITYNGSIVTRGTASLTGYGSSASATRLKGFGIDASQSSSVYQTTTEVRPQNAYVNYIIKV